MPPKQETKPVPKQATKPVVAEKPGFKPISEVYTFVNPNDPAGERKINCLLCSSTFLAKNRAIHEKSLKHRKKTGDIVISKPLDPEDILDIALAPRPLNGFESHVIQSLGQIIERLDDVLDILEEEEGLIEEEEQENGQPTTPVPIPVPIPGVTIAVPVSASVSEQIPIPSTLPNSVSLQEKKDQ